MASTNKTTNYELSQFLGTDKPAWLSDYNTDMNKIDTQMKANADGVTSVSGAAGATATALGDITSLATTDKTSAVAAINEVNTKAVTAQNSANGANQGVSANAIAIQAIKDYLNLQSASDSLTITTNSGTIVTGSLVKSAKNNDGSLGKIYGKLIINSPTSANTVITLSDTGLRPTEAINISGLVTLAVYGSSGIGYVTSAPITINTNGTATITMSGTDVDHADIFLPPCLLFMQNFGD